MAYRANAKRRLVLCCDGTWNSSDPGEAATNVLRLARIVNPLAKDGVHQIVYYNSGVGTGGVCDSISGGAVGTGLSRNVRNAYAFLVNNYQDDDEIFLFGFSRGAYTARSVAGLIGRIGILRKRQMGAFDEAWDWNRRTKDERKASWQEFDERFQGRRTGVRVRCIGVWDTVGALGVPANRITGSWQPCSQAYRFLDVNLGAHVEHAYQALSLDERRSPFLPSIWTPDPQAAHKEVQQVWFRGVHSDIGGGYQRHGAADIALLWMAERVRHLLDLDATGLEHELDQEEFGTESKLHDSFGWTWHVAGAQWRDPGTNPSSLATQYIHPTAVDWPDTSHPPRNPRADLRDLPVWTPTGFELWTKQQRSRRTMGDKQMHLTRGGPCDWLIGKLGGG